MSDHPPPSGEPELELDRPAPKPEPTPAPPQRVSNPNLQAVRSAARAQPLPSGPPPKKAARDKLQEGAVDTILNSFSILSEVLEDFRSSDRFFKYKALVLVLWFSLTIGAFGVACPSQGPTNDIDAKLVVAGDATTPYYMVKNESSEPWQNVEFIVNGMYRSTMATVDKNGQVTLSAGVLFDGKGGRAPSNLRITDITVQVGDPEATVELLKDGQRQ